MEVQCSPVKTSSRCFWARTAGSMVGLPLPHSTGTAWKHYPLKVEQMLHIALWDQEVCYQHADVWGGLAALTKATAPAGTVLAGHSDPSPWPTDGSEGCCAHSQACTLQLQCLCTTLKRSYFYSYSQQCCSERSVNTSRGSVPANSAGIQIKWDRFWTRYCTLLLCNDPWLHAYRQHGLSASFMHDSLPALKIQTAAWWTALLAQAAVTSLGRGKNEHRPARSTAGEAWRSSCTMP